MFELMNALLLISRGSSARDRAMLLPLTLMLALRDCPAGGAVPREDLRAAPIDCLPVPVAVMDRREGFDIVAPVVVSIISKGFWF